MTTPTLVLHGTPLSGHVHRVELLLRMLGLPYRFVAAPAEVRATPAFRALNPLGQIPVLEDGDLVLADSNAILVYLAKRYGAGTPWWPEAPVAAAQVQRFLSLAAGEIRFGPALARRLLVWGGRGELETAHAIAADVLAFLDGHLADRAFLATDQPTIADLACYSYVAAAPEGRISLADVPHVRAWLARIEALPNFQAMPPAELPAGAPR